MRHPDVDITSVEMIRPPSVCVEQVGLWAIDQIGLRIVFKALGLGPSMPVAAVGSLIARMAQPGTERAARCWLTKHSILGDLLGGKQASRTTLYRTLAGQQHVTTFLRTDGRALHVRQATLAEPPQ